MNKPFFLSKLLIALILCPFFVFLYKSTTLRLPPSSEWFSVFLSTFAQAGLSALLSLLLGVAGALGLCAFPSASPSKLHTKTGFINLPAIQLFCLLPALLPPLVTGLAYINVSEWFFRFPFSFYTVLSVHVLMNMGLVSVFFSRLLNQQASPLSAYAFGHGANRWLFLKTLLFFELRKDLLLLFLLVFSFCWTSFSVPLLVGGTHGQTIEVFIAEKLKDPATWPEAMALFALETSLVFVFFFLIYKNPTTHQTVELQANGSKTNGSKITGKSPVKRFKGLSFVLQNVTLNQNPTLYLLPCRPFILLPLLPAGLILIGLLGGLPLLSLHSFWPDIWLIKGDIISAWTYSVLVGLGAGFITFALLSLVAFCLFDLFLRRFLIAWTGASTAFMGFAFLLLGTDGLGAVWLKWALGLSLLFLPALYRLGGESVLGRLKEQAQVAKLMGAGYGMIFKKIIHPQCQQAFWFLSGVASFWAVGDFAYSSIVAGEHTHLALLIQDLLASYRLELATLLTWLLLMTGALCFFIFATCKTG